MSDALYLFGDDAFRLGVALPSRADVYRVRATDKEDRYMEMRQAIAATLVLLAAVAAVTCMAGMADGGYRIESDSRLIRAAITAFSITVIGYYGKLRRRLKSAKSLPIGEFTLAVRGDAWLPYQAIIVEAPKSPGVRKMRRRATSGMTQAIDQTIRHPSWRSFSVIASDVISR